MSKKRSLKELTPDKNETSNNKRSKKLKENESGSK